MPNYKTAFGSFLKTEDLQGRAVRLTIESVSSEEIDSDRGKEKKLVARFTGKEKGLVLNRTNADSIAEIAGSEDTDEWAGVTIALFPDKTKFAGKTVDCMRIRAVQANGKGKKPAPPPPPDPEPDTADVVDDDVPF